MSRAMSFLAQLRNSAAGFLLDVCFLSALEKTAPLVDKRE